MKKAEVHNALVNAAMIGNLMGIEAPLFGIIDIVADCAYKLTELEAEYPNAWEESETLVNDWDTVCDKLAKELTAMSHANDNGMQVPEISKKKIMKLMGIRAKTFYRMDNIGKAKYTINHHDGVQTNKDGSPFFGITICKNKKELKKCIDKLIAQGYKEKV